MELSRQRMRERTLNQFKHVRTCILARELCLLVRINRVAFNAEDAREHCAFIAKLCSEAGCGEQSDLCSKAAESVRRDIQTQDYEDPKGGIYGVVASERIGLGVLQSKGVARMTNISTSL